MEKSQSVPEMVAVAQTNAKIFEDRISAIREHVKGQNPSEAQIEDFRAANVALELAAVDIFTFFEARMQSHFKRGPFSRKLRAALLGAGRTELADRVHNYYLAINVLKHGKGASYRELLGSPSELFKLGPAVIINSEEEHVPSRLIDISAAGFFDGLATTLLEAYQFLEPR
jgi:hypothetical protein